MSNPFLVPQTPPRFKSNNNNKVSFDNDSHIDNNQKHMNNYETPNRPNKSILLTPSTISKNNNHKTSIFDQPSHLHPHSHSHIRRKSNSSNYNKSSFPFTPKTPQKSPTKSQNQYQTSTSNHHIYNRKKNLNDIFLESSSNTTSSSSNAALLTPSKNEKLSFGLFLPSPSTVGKGRNYNSINKNLNHSPILFDKKKIEELKNLKPSYYEEEEDIDVETEDEILKEEEQDDPAELKIPSTPKKQLIDDIKVKEWHGKSFNNKFLDDEDDETSIMTLEDTKKIPKIKLINPFLEDDNENNDRKFTSGVHLNDQHSSKQKDINYNTHMELIDKQGNKKIIKLSKNQLKYKPKKLNFENI
ncbi:uncharacterized protein KGF55_005304 [Candida pseudojiufengensis]|uniref:uncharacterized protein n=1 Tax=Candida pseudojiufengensis TaxID=497109 RepID=UPI002224D419|nr:uncharacterized protein KGF55_005304 [Candida pseudojiufengensis]KAI5959476.1 hypothetical protein KGF55_005304 [Candida pseudojiufengensis]